MIRRWRTHIALSCALLTLTGCYSLMRVRKTVEMTSATRSAVIHVWENSPNDTNIVWGSFVSVLLYPFDIVWSTGAALDTIGCPYREIRGGAVGALGAILLPGLTLVAPDLRVFMSQPPYGILNNLSEDEFDAVLEAVRGGTAVPSSKNTEFLRRPFVDRIEVADGEPHVVVIRSEREPDSQRQRASAGLTRSSPRLPWSGRPGRLPSPAPLRSGRASSIASGSSIDGFATRACWSGSPSFSEADTA
jgi:hypothetical protein